MKQVSIRSYYKELIEDTGKKISYKAFKSKMERGFHAYSRDYNMYLMKGYAMKEKSSFSEYVADYLDAFKAGATEKFSYYYTQYHVETTLKQARQTLESFKEAVTVDAVTGDVFNAEGDRVTLPSLKELKHMTAQQRWDTGFELSGGDYFEARAYYTA